MMALVTPSPRRLRAAALATLVLLSNVVVAADRSVRTIGDERVVLNSMVQATLRFTPGMIKVASGGTVTWTHDDNTTAPHTVTIVANPPGASLDEISKYVRETVSAKKVAK